MMVVVSVTACGTPSMFKKEYEKLRAVQIGWTEDQVKACLGEPFKVYTKESATENHCVQGREYRNRAITSKVWICIIDEPIAYVCFDDQSKVEEVLPGGVELLRRAHWPGVLNPGRQAGRGSSLDQGQVPAGACCVMAGQTACDPA